jgi:hypothetical protein
MTYSFQHLKRSLKVHPFGISAPLGINIPEDIDIEDLDIDNFTNWAFLKETGSLLECFGGNHLLEATKQLYEEYKDDKNFKSHFATKLCTVYYGLTDDEIIKVSFTSKFILIYTLAWS